MGRTDCERGRDLPCRGPAFTFADSLNTTSDFISATIQLPSALAPNSGGLTPCALPTDCTSFSISDGVDTLTGANTTLFVDLVTTNAAGLPNFWRMEAEVPAGGPLAPLAVFSENTVGPFGAQSDGVPAGFPTPCANPQVFYCATFIERPPPNTLNPPHSEFWSIVPEPLTGSLSALSLLMVSALARAPRSRV
jgi:hypothetical protein